MSWSFYGVGLAEKLSAKVDKDIVNSPYKCTEPEESLRQAAGDLIKKSLDAQSPGTAVRVSASGSQSQYGNNGELVVNNSLEIKVEAFWDFAK